MNRNCVITFWIIIRCCPFLVGQKAIETLHDGPLRLRNLLPDRWLRIGIRLGIQQGPTGRLCHQILNTFVGSPEKDYWILIFVDLIGFCRIQSIFVIFISFCTCHTVRSYPLFVSSFKTNFFTDLTLFFDIFVQNWTFLSKIGYIRLLVIYFGQIVTL